MKAKRVKIQSEHYPNAVDLVWVILDIDNAKKVIENITGLTYTTGELTSPNQVIDFAWTALNAEITDFEEDELEDAVSIVLATEIAEIIDGKVYCAVNEGVDINQEEPFNEQHDAEGRICDYIVYSNNPEGHFVFETDKIVEHLLAGGESYAEFIAGVKPVRKKRIQKKAVAVPPTKDQLRAQLKQALHAEEYERAAELRDLLNKM